MNEKNVQIEKIQKTSKVVLIVTNIIKWIAIVGMVLCLLAGISMLIMQDSFNEVINISSQAGDDAIMIEEIMMQMESEVLEGMAKDGNFAVVIGTYMVTMGIILAEMAVLFHFIGRVFKTLRESYSPFVPKIVKQLKIAFILIALLSFSSSLGMGAVVSLALWCVFNIFQYGCELQRQSDETL